MKYLSLDSHYPFIFNIISQTLSFRSDPIPDYLSEELGLDRLSGILERIKMPYYNSFFEKCSYLFIGLVLGHYFSNGNKRLAITSLTFFAQINGFQAKKISRRSHMDFIHHLYPDMTFNKKIRNATVFDDMLYNFTLYIASGKTTFQEATPRTKEYLQFSLEKKQT